MAPKSSKVSRQNTLKLVAIDGPRPAKKLRRLNPLTNGAPIFDLSPSPSSSTHSPPPSQPLPPSQPSSNKSRSKLESNRGFKVPSIHAGLSGKGKAKAQEPVADDLMWVDVYEPETEEDLAVHKRKVNDVRQWLLEAFQPSKLQKYRRLLVLTGPAGSGKTTTLRVLSRELGFEILEWRNPLAVATASSGRRARFDNHNPYDSDLDDSPYDDDPYESTMDKFEAFLTRAGSYRSIFSSSLPSSSSLSPSPAAPGPSSSRTQTSSQQPPQKQQQQKQQLILLEDLPNILHPSVRDRFHATLKAYLAIPSSYSSSSSAQASENEKGRAPAPIVIIISDTGLRGEGSEEKFLDGVAGGSGSGGGGGRGGGREEVLDYRSVVGEVGMGAGAGGVTRIEFNPIAPTYLTSALKSLLVPFDRQHLSTFDGLFECIILHPSPPPTSPHAKRLIDIVVSGAGGDVRSAVMSLQFAMRRVGGGVGGIESGGTEREGGKKATKARKGSTNGSMNMMDAAALATLTRKENAMALFHLMGRVLYNKRKNDPPSSHATARDTAAEKALDATLRDPPELPGWLRGNGGGSSSVGVGSGEERRTSRVDVDLLYASTPIDASLYNLYIHQNYTQFCEEIEQCERLVDGLSWVDASGGENWYQSNPYTVHISTLSTLHALPSPVPRKNQKMHKPEFFENLRKTRTADEDGMGGVRGWLTMTFATGTIQPASLWSRHSIVLELPGVLKALSHRPSHPHRPPPANHTLFSSLLWSRHASSSMAVTLEEGDDEAAGAMEEMEREMPESGTAVEVDDDGDGGAAEAQNGWLEDDEIEDW
ncbi:Rad17-domain-containing protein [Stereum hirsutum FP-91666 SS1]|uniref:Rad17-domain-containing protein n=1 Tax=Stereum hirsutum (strain FP-91666) TaxID=721885 RepID=R7RXV7_STEHR|nr:Rad17-domain-containing protein [Stereum hirsutum FP-91666 SS1]EIM79628.1 Rad17-domain-containing protein [Stereum hirsutum FP-91666 SS1]